MGPICLSWQNHLPHHVGLCDAFSVCRWTWSCCPSITLTTTDQQAAYTPTPRLKSALFVNCFPTNISWLLPVERPSSLAAPPHCWHHSQRYAPLPHAHWRSLELQLRDSLAHGCGRRSDSFRSSCTARALGWRGSAGSIGCRPLAPGQPAAPACPGRLPCRLLW